MLWLGGRSGGGALLTAVLLLFQQTAAPPPPSPFCALKHAHGCTGHAHRFVRRTGPTRAGLCMPMYGGDRDPFCVEHNGDGVAGPGQPVHLFDDLTGSI